MEAVWPIDPVIGFVDDEFDFLVDVEAATAGRARVTTDTREALGWVRERRVDAIVTDLRMGGESGADFLLSVRDADAEIPVTLWTGFEPTRSEQKSLTTVDAKVMSKMKVTLDDVIGYVQSLFVSEPLFKLRAIERRVGELEAVNREWIADMVEQLRSVPDAENAMIATVGQPFSVAQLVEDIEQLRPRGIEYIRLWRGAQARVRRLRRAGK